MKNIVIGILGIISTCFILYLIPLQYAEEMPIFFSFVGIITIVYFYFRIFPSQNMVLYWKSALISLFSFMVIFLLLIFYCRFRRRIELKEFGEKGEGLITECSQVKDKYGYFNFTIQFKSKKGKYYSVIEQHYFPLSPKSKGITVNIIYSRINPEIFVLTSTNGLFEIIDAHSVLIDEIGSRPLHFIRNEDCIFQYSWEYILHGTCEER